MALTKRWAVSGLVIWQHARAARCFIRSIDLSRRLKMSVEDPVIHFSAGRRQLQQPLADRTEQQRPRSALLTAGLVHPETVDSFHRLKKRKGQAITAHGKGTMKPMPRISCSRR